jgi:hypothetical protein
MTEFYSFFFNSFNKKQFFSVFLFQTFSVYNNFNNFKFYKKKFISQPPLLRYVSEHDPILRTQQNYKYIKFSKVLIFNIFFLTGFIKNYNFFLIHHQFRKMYLLGNKNFHYLNTTLFFNKWHNGLNFLFHIFYFNSKLILLGTEFFKKETNVFNWLFLKSNTKFWNYYFSYFIFKTSKINTVTNSFFLKLKKYGIDMFLIYDCYYHFKNLYYINKYGFFSIALTNARINPWIVSYSFPVINDSFMTHLLFFNIINFSFKQAFVVKYQTLFKNWFYLQLLLQTARTRL